MDHRLPLLLPLLGLCACAGEVDPGAERLIDGPRWQAPPAQARPPAPPGAPAGQPAFTPPDTPIVTEPPGPTPTGPVMAEPPLPPAWSDQALAVVARQVDRRVMVSEAVVGVAALPDDGVLALSAEGGLFHTGDWRPLRARPTPLPAGGFTRLHGWGEAVLACRPAGAWGSDDGGLSWAPAGFGCGAAGRPTLAVAGGRLYRLEGDGIVRSAWPGGDALGRTALTLDRPQAVAAFDQTVVVFGPSGVLRSLDGGQRFQPAEREDGGRLDVRSVVFLSKTRAVAVGEAPADAGVALVSDDGGARWRAVPLPRRAEALHDVAVTARGGVAAVTDPAAGLAFASEDGGETWQPLAPGAPVATAVATRRRGGVVAASPRGVARTLAAPAVSQTLGLAQPLWAVALSHPQVAVGAGVESGLFRTVDGGRAWQQVPGTLGVRFADVVRVADHRFVAVGDGLLWASEDAGRRWAAAVPPASCQARWVRFTGRVGAVACADGHSLISDDAGEGWRVGPELPGDLGPVAWRGGQGVAPRLDGSGVAVSDGLHWRLEEAPALVDVQVGGDGWTGITAHGALWSRSPDGGWRPLDTGSLGPTVAHRWSADGVLVRVGPQGVWRHSARGSVRLAEVPGTRAVALAGDGGLWLLGDHATTALTPR